MAEPGEYQITREGGEKVLRINYEGAIYTPSIEDDRNIMSRIFDIILDVGKVSKIVFLQREEYEYDWPQVRLLLEVVDAYKKLVKEENILDFGKMAFAPECQRFLPAWSDFLRDTIMHQLKEDPIGAFVSLVRRHREEMIKQQNPPTPEYASCGGQFLGILQHAIDVIGDTTLIKLAASKLPGFKPDDRTVYREHFRPSIRPYFMYTKLVTAFPAGAEELASYKIAENTEVLVLKVPTDIRPLYHIIPPEFKLTEDRYALLTEAREVMAEHRPQKAEFIDPARTREIFFAVERDLLADLAKAKGMKLSYRELEELARILLRYTIGFGLIEILISDPNVQDIVVNSPLGSTPVSIIHGDYGECRTNVTPLPKEGDSWATKLRLMSGRPFDEANPVLDSDLSLPYARARVAALQAPLSPLGYAFAFRRHRDQSWTLPLFIKSNMLTPMAAGLISFLVDGARTILIAGTRSAGKTSLLGAMMIEIARTNRILTVEDTLELPTAQLRGLNYDILTMKTRSVITGSEAEVPAEQAIRTALRLGDSALIIGEVRSSIPGWEEVLVVENGITKRIPIEELENKNIDKYKVPTLGSDLKVNLKPLADFVKHPKRDKLLEVTTKTGRHVVVTPDHSLFHATKDFKIAPIECKELKKGDSIVIPAHLPVGFNDINELNVIELLPEFRLENFESDTRRAIEKLGWKEATEIAKVTSGDIYNYFRTAPNQQINLPISSFRGLMQEAEIDFEPRVLKVTRGTGNPIPAIIPVNEDFCRFLGYYVSEGYYRLTKGEGGDVVLTNSDQNLLNDMIALSKKLFSIEPKMKKVYGAGESTQVRLGSTSLAALISKLNCGRLAAEKRAPPLIFGLSKPKIAAFLRGLYSGDGNFTSSESSGNCARYYSTSKKLVEDVAYLLLAFGIVGTIRCHKARNQNSNDVWLVEFKDRDMVETFFREIGFNREVPKMIIKGWKHTNANSVKFDKEGLKKHLLKYPRRFRHLFRFQKCSKRYLKQVVNDTECKVSTQLKAFANGEFFLDEVNEIRELNLENPVPVYDLSVEPSQNFIGGFGGILLHNTEARALYEAMRVGALAKVVAGTIHGASPYAVYDRVVNDLGVPKTSFKATDIIMVANVVTSPSGFERWRRLTQISEVRKLWTDDPLLEKGFADLMTYNAAKDIIETTGTLVEGESEVLKAIGGRVREWSGNWDAIWQNIELRAKIKQAIVEASDKAKIPNLLEASFNVASNDEFHRLCDIVAKEVGFTDPKRVFNEWQNWLKQRIRKMKGV